VTVDKVIAKIIWLTFFGPPSTYTVIRDGCNIYEDKY